MRLPSKIKLLLQTNQAWWRYFQNNADTIRPVVVQTIINLLSCGLTVRGYDKYHCSNPACSHCKIVCFSCNGRFCNTCGHKATEQWIEKQNTILPRTTWQHITLTMPGELWAIFELNRHLLGHVSRLGVKPLLTLAKRKGIVPGIFTALHTFGRDLNWNVHLHLSITLGGLNLAGTAWKAVSFAKKQLMPMWRYEIINLLRQSYDELVLPESIRQQYPDAQSFNRFLDSHYQKPWIVHFAKPTKHHKHTVSYLGRYIKRPPLAMSRLIHYDGKQVIFQYLDHRTHTHRQFDCETDEFIERFTRHIPEKGFRLIRYYGFLANRVRGTLLPIVYRLLNQTEKNNLPIHWPNLLKRSFGLDPLTCILCQSPMVLTKRVIGLSGFALRQHHQSLALMKPIA